MKKFFLSAFSLLTCLCLHAQSKTMAGYIVKLSGDTLKGQLERGIGDLTPEFIVLNGQKYQPADIKGFGVPDEEQYISATVSYHQGSLIMAHLTEEFPKAAPPKTIFLHKLMVGKYNLYRYQSSEREYFFSQRNSEPITELVYRKSLTPNEGVVKEDLQYRNQLIAYANEENAADKVIDRIKELLYQIDAMSWVYKQLNGSTARVFSKRVDQKQSSLEIGGGLVQGSFNSSAIPSLFTSPVTNPSISGSAGPLVEVNFVSGNTHKGKRVLYGITAAYAQTPLKATGQNSNTTYTFKSSFNTIALSVQMYYFFNPLSSTLFYVSPQVTLNNLLEKGTTEETTGSGPTKTTSYSYLKSSYFAAAANIGIRFGRNRINGRFEHGFSATTPSSNVLNPKRISISYHYRLFDF